MRWKGGAERESPPSSPSHVGPVQLSRTPRSHATPLPRLDTSLLGETRQPCPSHRELLWDVRAWPARAAHPRRCATPALCRVSRALSALELLSSPGPKLDTAAITSTESADGSWPPEGTNRTRERTEKHTNREPPQHCHSETSFQVTKTMQNVSSALPSAHTLCHFPDPEPHTRMQTLLEPGK